MEKKSMTNFKPLAMAVIATAMMTTPVFAKHHHHVRHIHHVLADGVAVNAPPAPHYVNGRPCVAAPRVDAFATAPWENETPCEP
jgi:hypothetical protein